MHYFYSNPISLGATAGIEFSYKTKNFYKPLREESRLRVFENRVLRRVFGPKEDEVTREWRRLHSKELCTPYQISFR